jgi:hypothetical protein
MQAIHYPALLPPQRLIRIDVCRMQRRHARLETAHLLGRKAVGSIK